MDLPSKVFDVDFVKQLQAMGATASLRHIIITRLTPERLPVLTAVLQACEQRGVQLLLSNPALQLLNERAEADEALARALRGVQLEAVSRGSTLSLSKGRALRFIPIPTPRWPDLVAVYSEEGELARGVPRAEGRARCCRPSAHTLNREPAHLPAPHPLHPATDNILFSSNFFSAHTASEAVQSGAADGARRSAADLGGWQKFGPDWEFYFECMMAPVARQVASECWGGLCGG